jgi:hypothetical protein
VSLVKVQGNASGTGIFTITSPNSNTDRTLTLPDQTGTVLTNAGPFTASTSTSAGAITLDAANNAGIGVTPNSWDSAYRALQVGVSGFQALSANSYFLGNNAYYSATGWKFIVSAAAPIYEQNRALGAHIWYTSNSGTAGGTPTFTEVARFDASANMGIGTTGPDCALTIAKNPGTGGLVLHLTRPGIADNVLMYASDAYGPNGAAATAKFGSISSTNRSIAATGTINASGADYAEYMTKAGDFTVAKGDVIGVNAHGQLTNVFAEAHSFVVKSTSPSYVGGDVWGTAEAIGHKQPTPLPDGASDEERAAYEVEVATFETALEAARQKVDRIAFAGQVPVNVTGATPGQYIVPTDDGGAIKGVAVSNPTFEQYQLAVGKVIAVEADGRARIIVKVT